MKSYFWKFVFDYCYSSPKVTPFKLHLSQFKLEGVTLFFIVVKQIWQ